MTPPERCQAGEQYFIRIWAKGQLRVLKAEEVNMRTIFFRLLSPLSGVLIATQVVVAQTIPEIVAREDQSLGRTVEIETGPPPSIESVVQQAELIVRGVIGTPKSYLSDDQMEVLSDYPILNPIVLWSSIVNVTPLPGKAPPLIVTHIGGTVPVLGHTFTMEHTLLPPLVPGTEGIFLLKRKGDKYHIAGTFYGAFKISSDLMVPLIREPEFAKDIRGLRSADGAARLVEIKKQKTQ
ncbi:MAG TPA: hypothetical protein VJM31_08160 [Vicinamibacterales bacterium]|nr:hypothetical protein [Vicinamibacterales bacterium]